MKVDENNYGIGAPLRRVEDEPLLRGTGCFIDDMNLDNQVYAGFLRSWHASADVTALNADDALELPGAIAVFGPDDLAREGIGLMRSGSSLKNIDGTAILSPDRTVLSSSARFVGDTLAMVIAETTDAVDAMLEALDVSFDVKDPVLEAEQAWSTDSDNVWPQHGTNRALEWSMGDVDAVNAIFDSAAHTVSHQLVNNRVMLAALEPRGVLATFDVTKDLYTLYTPTQGGNQVREEVANALLIGADQVRVVTPDVGGGFGIKNGAYPEQVLAAFAARHCQRPVKWYASRADAFLCDYHARDHIMRGQLALDSEGQFLAIRSFVLSNMGAYLTGAAPIIPTAGGTRMLANVYRTPQVYAHTRCVYTNTPPVAAFRGAGKPEYAHLVETLVDEAAKVIGMEPSQLRRLNMITPDAMPWTTPTGLVYDSGNFEKHMDAALSLAASTAMQARPPQLQHALRTLRGRGFSVYTEPDGYLDNRAKLSFDVHGNLSVTSTAQTNGQGHYTTYTQIAHSLLGVDVDCIRVIEGDTDLTGSGRGSGGSRSTTVTGAAMVVSAEHLIEKGTQLAAHLMETSHQDVEFSDGNFYVKGTDQRTDWIAISALAHDDARRPDHLDAGLDAEHLYQAPVYCYPSGCHVCDVEIDSDTGQLTVLSYLSVSDFGTVINPDLVAGQLHGGVAQGLGQAMFEHTVFDLHSGQLLSGSFMDYCIPRATQLPSFQEVFDSTRCTTNPLGVKGCGESGPTASLPALDNAVRHALQDYDTTDLTMPFTSEKIWRTIHSTDRQM